MMYSTDSLDLVAYDMNFLIMCAMFITAPCFGGTSAWLVRKKCLPARLIALGSLRYLASLWAARIISLALYVMISSSCVDI